MKIGFLDSIYNYADIYEAAVKVLDEQIPSVTLERMTVPHLLKIPLFSKFLFNNGCDAVIVFLTMLEEDADELNLVHEKIIDLELEQTKPVYFCIISDAEFKNQEELEVRMQERLKIIAEAVAKIVSSPSGLSSDIANQNMTNAMSMFGALSEATQEAASGEIPSEPIDSIDLGEEGKSLF